MAGRVAEWRRRKDTHTHDPMLAQQLMQMAGGGRQQAGGGTAVVAKLGRAVLARSSRVQYVNQRAYFPVEDCVAARFLPSGKRWR